MSTASKAQQQLSDSSPRTSAAAARASGQVRSIENGSPLYVELLPAILLAVSVAILALLELEFIAALDFGLVRGALLLLALWIAIVMAVRSLRHARFVAELRSMLRQIQSGEGTMRFYFREAVNSADRALALAFSEAHKQMARRFKAVVDERNSEDAIIASMAEGVLGVDLRERVVRLNPAASELLQIPAGEVLGRPIQEVVRSPDLQRFVRAVLQGQSPEESEVVLRGVQERSLRMSGRELLSAEGEKTGAIVVLSDITRLRKLERTRSDFIANVSHELKTPVTSIQGFAETLLDGALNNPEDARRFVGIISRQAERLGQIFDEMLVLSRLEQEEQIELVATELRPIIAVAVQNCEPRATQKQSRIEVECAADLLARCHAPLLEQAISNLVDNGIKYSPEGSTVWVTASPSEGGILISVQDNGPGIEPQHLPRIFERFYRVDKGRSRSEGGTGLGLAIVKHIAQAHGGQASVESTPGEGSRFSIVVQSGPAAPLELAG